MIYKKLNMITKNNLSLGVDIGGTKVSAGVINKKGNIIDSLNCATPNSNPKAVKDTIIDLIVTLMKKHEVDSIGIGAAGWVNLEGSKIFFSPHLSWRNELLKKNLEKIINREIFIFNDADAAGWAEFKFGAGLNCTHLVCLTLGTGIGGSIILNGKLERGKFGVAGECGHQVILPQGQLCECGNKGCLEQYASGNALGREARELAKSNSPVAQELLKSVNNKISLITGHTVTSLAKKGDPASIELVEDIGKWLGLGLANVASILDPDKFIIGGGLSSAGDLLLIPTKRSFYRNLTGRGFRPAATISLAYFGPNSGIVGAADLARESLLSNNK